MTTTGQSLVTAALSETGNNTALARLLAFLAAAVGDGNVVAPLPNVLFVDGSFDGAGQGSIIAPFVTIAEAMAAISQNDTTIVVLPGVYAELVVVPPTRSGISIVGLSRKNTRIAGTGVGATNTLTFAPTSALALSFELNEIAVSSTSTGFAINIDASGAGSPTAALTNLLISNVDAPASGTASLNLISVNNFTVSNCSFDHVVVSNCAVGKFQNCTGVNFALTFNSAGGTQPTTTRNFIRLESTRFNGTMTLASHPMVFVDAASVVETIASSSLSVANGLAPNIEFHGRQGTSVIDGTVTITLPTPAVTASIVNFSGATLLAPSVGISTPAGVQPFDFRKVNLQHAAGVIAVTGAGVANLDVRGMTAKVAIPYTVAGGAHTVDRDRVVALGAAVTAAAKTFTFGTTAPFAAEPPFPAGATFAITGTRTDATHTAAPDVLSVTAQSVAAFTTGAQTNATTVAFVITRTGALASSPWL